MDVVGAVIDSAQRDENQIRSMLTRYLESAMRQAQFEQLEDGSWYGSIPGFEGVWANAAQLEACREELREVLEEWLLIGLSMGHPVPAMDGIDLRITEVA